MKTHLARLSGIFAAILLFAACSKTYQANGYIYSQLDKQPIDSARVTVYLGDSLQVYDQIYTDTSGYFRVEIGELSCGAGSCPGFWMVLSAPGHKDKKITEAEGEKIYLDIL